MEEELRDAGEVRPSSELCKEFPPARES